jgi:hypothetical protein
LEDGVQVGMFLNNAKKSNNVRLQVFRPLTKGENLQTRSRILTGWLNFKLEDHYIITDLRRDLMDGTALCALADCLEGKKPALYPTPKSRQERRISVQNAFSKLNTNLICIPGSPANDVSISDLILNSRLGSLFTFFIFVFLQFGLDSFW